MNLYFEEFFNITYIVSVLVWFQLRGIEKFPLTHAGYRLREWLQLGLKQQEGYQGGGIPCEFLIGVLQLELFHFHVCFLHWEERETVLYFTAAQNGFQRKNLSLLGTFS